MRATIYPLAVLTILLAGCTDDKSNYTVIQSEKVEIGKALFFDSNLSNPAGQSCASCHAPEKGFSDPNNSAISSGIIPGSFGSRNAPALAYTVFSPMRYYNSVDETFVGGLFIDGRSPSLQEQFIHPLLNPLEMNNTSVHQVVEKIKAATYFSRLKDSYGPLTIDEEIINAVADAVSNYEKSREVNSFTSKFDYYSRKMISFTEEEEKGLALFAGKAKCANCHILEPDDNTGKILFTDFTYDNLGVPKNQTNPFYTQSISSNPVGYNYIDLGIGFIVGQPQHNGKFKVPTLRNIATTGPYFHNGSFSTLKQVVHFYNTRDLNTGEFGPPEVPQNVNTEELGNLQLTPEEENQLVKFLETLTDHYRQ